MQKLGWLKKLKDKPNKEQNEKMTPHELAKLCINLVPFENHDVLLDCCRGEGAFFNQYPSENPKDWCEINEGKDFFDYEGTCDYIITNPSYTLLTKIYEKAVKIARKGICLLVGNMNLCVSRFKMLEENNFSITKLFYCKVAGWFGTSVFVIAEKNKPSIVNWNTDVFDMPEKEKKIYTANMKEYQKNYYKNVIKKRNEMRK